MRTVSNTMPQGFLIEAIYDSMCDLVFTTNVEEIEVPGEEGETITQYQYDMYRMRVPYTETLEGRIEANYNVWLAKAASDEMANVKAAKIDEVREACNAAIIAGVDVTTTYGDEHFSLDSYDQQNLASIRALLDDGIEEYPYHADGKQVVMYDAIDLTNITDAAMFSVKWNTTYCNMLRVWINREEDETVVLGIRYGINLPADLQEDMDELMG